MSLKLWCQQSLLSDPRLKFASRIAAVTDAVLLFTAELRHRSARRLQRLESRVITEALAAARLGGADPKAATFNGRFSAAPRIAVCDRTDVFETLAWLGFVDQ